MSHTDIHNHLTGAEALDTSAYEHVVTIRKEKLKGWNGYEVISESTDSYLIGKKKSAEQLKKETDLKAQKELKIKAHAMEQERIEKEHETMIEESKKQAQEDADKAFNEAVEKRVKEELQKIASESQGSNKDSEATEA